MMQTLGFISFFAFGVCGLIIITWIDAIIYLIKRLSK